MNTAVTTTTNFFTRCWAGQEKLWKVFWLGGLLVGTADYLVDEMMLQLHSRLVLFIILAIASAMANLWWVVSVVRCSENTSNRLYTWAARIVAFIKFVFLLGSMLVLVFG